MVFISFRRTQSLAICISIYIASRIVQFVQLSWFVFHLYFFQNGLSFQNCRHAVKTCLDNAVLFFSCSSLRNPIINIHHSPATQSLIPCWPIAFSNLLPEKHLPTMVESSYILFSMNEELELDV